LHIVVNTLAIRFAFALLGVVTGFATHSADAQATQGSSPAANQLPPPSNDPATPDVVIPPSKLLHFDSQIRIPNRYMVKFKDDKALAADVSARNAADMKIAPSLLPDSETNIKSLANSISTTYQQKEGKTNTILGVWTRPGGRGFGVEGISEGDITELAQDPRVEFVEPDMYAQAQTVQIQNTGKPSCSGNCAPWHLDRLDQRSGLDGLYHYDATGQGAIVVVIDTGWQLNHSDFSDIVSGGGATLLDCTSINGCANTLPPTSNYDCNGHGTAVTSVLAGKTFGVSKGVLTVYGLRASPDCSLNLTATAIVNAIQYARFAAEPISEVINMSFIFQGVNTIVDQWVNIVIDNGVTVVVAAGNAVNGIGNGSDACNYTPAHNSRAIRVASTDSNDTRVSDSNFGPCIDIFAPGGSILSADNGGALYSNTACAAVFPNTTATCFLSGTSFATPIVSGIAALYLQNNMYADPATVKSVILANATMGAVQNAGAGSPNLLAYVGVPGNSSGGVVGGGGGGVVPANIVNVIVDTLLLQ